VIKKSTGIKTKQGRENSRRNRVSRRKGNKKNEDEEEK
jgi:hypothetical protein